MDVMKNPKKALAVVVGTLVFVALVYGVFWLVAQTTVHDIDSWQRQHEVGK